MSKEHYVTPEEFNILVRKGKLIKLAYGITTNVDLKYAQRVIDELRKINWKDPGFKYSCECNKEETIWLFGYTSSEIFNMADAKCKEIIIQNRIERNEPTINITGVDFGNRAACSCPFDL